MYHRTRKGLSVNLFGASTVSTVIDGTDVNIEQTSRYPFDGTVRLEVESGSAASFQVRVRVPGWAAGVEVEGASFVRDGNWIVFDRVWEGSTEINLQFERQVRILEHASGTVAIAHGPLLYALPIDHEEIKGTSYAKDGFHDIYARPVRSGANDWQVPANAGFTLTEGEERIAGPFDSLVLKGTLYVESEDRLTEVRLVPMGGTILRQVSFAAAATIREVEI